MRSLLYSFLFFCVILFCAGCLKQKCGCVPPPDATGNGSYKLFYSDSVYYLNNSSADYTVKPVIARTDGSYSSFPDGLKLDDKTGAISVNQSETGLRYRVSFTAANGSVFSTMVVISGVNYMDSYYRLSQGDSIALPVYNANGPLGYTGSFDYSGSAQAEGVAITAATGAINLAKTLRSGFFGSHPWEKRKEIEVRYKLNDKSNGSSNSIKILLYYYRRLSDVPQELRQTVDEHLSMMLHSTDTNATSKIAAKPRPPCVIIIAE